MEKGEERVNRPAYIIIHHSLTKDSGTMSWNAIRRYHTKKLGWRDIGYHFGIELVGGHYEILVGRMMTESAAHCKQEGMNSKSIGLMLMGNFDEFAPSKEMWDLSVRFVRSLLDIFHLPIERVVAHRDYASYKSCPGMAFDMDKFRQDVKS